MSKIIRNGIAIYKSRKSQFGHMSLEQFMKFLKSEYKQIHID
jgi:hypothetical protein